MLARCQLLRRGLGVPLALIWPRLLELRAEAAGSFKPTALILDWLVGAMRFTALALGLLAIALSGWICLATTSHASELADARAVESLTLTVTAPAAMPDRISPVSGGIPFPRGSLLASDGIRLRDAAGREVPVQTEVLATWDEAGREIKWLLVDFLPRLDAEKTNWTLEYGPGVEHAREAPAVDPAKSPWPPESLVDSLYITDQHGNTFRGRNEKAERSIEVETSGPLRTVVRVRTWHADEQGRRACRAILRLHYYAGLDQVRVFHSFVMDPDPEQVKLRAVGLDLAAAVGNQARMLVAGEQTQQAHLEGAGPVTLFQPNDREFSVTGAASAKGKRSGTWLAVEDDRHVTACFLRNGWEEYPKRISYDGRRIDVELWPRDGCPLFDLGRISHNILAPTNEQELRDGLAKKPTAITLYRFVTNNTTDWSYGTTVPLILQARKLEQELFPDRPAYYYHLFGENGRGSMKTHELVFAHLPRGAPGMAFARLAQFVRQPPVLAASPEWNCRSGTFGMQIPLAAGAFPEVDKAMTTGELLVHQEAVEQFRLYGARDWGDYLNGNPVMAGPIARVYRDDPTTRIVDRIGWQNCESQDSGVGVWIQFLRTGDVRIHALAEAQAEHVATVDHRHTFAADGTHRAGMFYHTLRHYDGGIAPSHALTGGLQLGYYVTGDRALRDVVLAAAEHWIAEQEKTGTGWYATTDPSRQNIAPMTCMLNAYLLTWNPRYLHSLDRFLAVWEPVFDVRKHYMGGTLPYPGAAFLRQVKHERFERAFTAMMQRIRTDLEIDGQSAYVMPGMAWMFERTGDPTWAAYCQFVLEFHADRLRRDGGSDLVMRRSLDVPDFGYGSVSGYFAEALALASKPEVRDQMEQALRQLGEMRAVAAGQDPSRGADFLAYGVPYSAEKPYRWYRDGRIELRGK